MVSCPLSFFFFRHLFNDLFKTVNDFVSHRKTDKFFYRFHRTLGYEGAPMHDPCAVMVLIHPEIFTIRDYYVEIETCGDFCKGATVPDIGGVLGKAPNASCLVDLDRKVFIDYLIDAISKYGEVRK